MSKLKWHFVRRNDRWDSINASKNKFCIYRIMDGYRYILMLNDEKLIETFDKLKSAKAFAELIEFR